MIVLDREEPLPVLYAELAGWWPLLSAPEDYREEAAFYLATLRSHTARPLGTALELGSGGGNNASHLKSHFTHMTLVDRAPGMLDVSRSLNPECEHVLGDMRSVRLGRRFDCVFVHDAICYATSRDDVRAVVETAHAHCEPGGVCLLAPDHVRETFRPSTSHGGHDGAGRSLRYLQWTWDPDPGDSTYVADYAIVLREGGAVRVVHDRHVEGLFATGEWLDVLTSVGFAATAVPFHHSEVDGVSTVFVGVQAGTRPGAPFPTPPAR